MSTYALYGEIVFPAYKGRRAFKIRRFSECTTKSSWQSLTNTAELQVPRKVKDFDRMKVTEWFREGDPIEIYLGYNGKLELEFSGYISKVPIGIPLTLFCEDEMVSVSKKNCTLKDLLNAIAPGYTIKCDETKLLGSVRFVKWSASEVLDELKKQGIHCWFEGKELHAFTTAKTEIDPVKVLLEKTAGESLKQKAVEDVMVTITLLKKAARDIKVEYGDKGAGKRLTRKYAGLELSTSEMLAEAKKIYNQAKIPGMDGDVTLFGLPRVVPGMKMSLKSAYYPEKDGVYYIDNVTKTFGQQGYRQQCKLGDKAI
jgi:hypothetical protein